MNEYLKHRMEHILAGRPLAQKKRVAIKPVSDKRKEKLKKMKESGEGSEMEAFFQSQRKRMVGTCQCGCAEKSQRNDDTYFRHSICHIFPKRIFYSVATHPLNWVERAFWGGCHTNMDEGGMDKWPGMADWDDIKEKFHELAPLLTDEERSTKFYSVLEKLIYQN